MYLIVEDKIRESIENGEFDNLPGKGKRLDLRDDLPGLSPELNQAYKILKNAGFVPEEGADTGKKPVTSGDLETYATGEANKEGAQNSGRFDAFVKDRKLHKNRKFSYYRQKIINKLF